MHLILFGPPGAGKGTQSAFLVKQYDLVHLSTGDIFRANIKNETELGKKAKGFMDQGQLVPDVITVGMLRDEVLNHPHSSGFIYDGFPRTVAQAQALDGFLSELGSSITALAALEVPEDELRIRLAERAKSSGRSDDANPEVIQKRIDVYNYETRPVMEHYKGQNKYSGVNGVGKIHEITERLIAAIDKLAAK